MLDNIKVEYDTMIPNNDTLLFNNNSTPNTQSNKRGSSLLSMKIVDQQEGNVSFEVSFNDLYESIFLSDSSIKIIGSGNIDNQGNIFYIDNDIVYRHNNLGKVELDEEGDNKKVLVYNDEYHFTDLTDGNLVYWNPNLDQILIEPPFIGGYYEHLDSIALIPLLSEASFGDLDDDSFDELIYLLPDNSLVVENYNQTYLNGFPVEGDFYGSPLIANIINVEDGVPEIISREGNGITILSNSGDRLLELSSYDPGQDIRIIEGWKDDKAALVDGNRLILFNYDQSHSYWLNKYSNSYDYPVSLNSNRVAVESNEVVQLAYNYPNPIEKGYTTFRFYATDDNEVIINIYDINGFKIEKLKLTQINKNEYNEIKWDNIQGLSAGLYYAEVIFESREPELIKLAIIQ